MKIVLGENHRAPLKLLLDDGRDVAGDIPISRIQIRLGVDGDDQRTTATLEVPLDGLEVELPESQVSIREFLELLDVDT